MQPDADATAELADLAAKGELTLRVAETVPLERFRDAYMRLERGGVPGRSCSRPERRRARPFIATGEAADARAGRAPAPELSAPPRLHRRRSVIVLAERISRRMREAHNDSPTAS